MFEEQIKWNNEPDSTTNLTEDGFLWFFTKEFEIRFKYEPSEGFHDRWTLHYLPTNRKWTRDGIAEDSTCKAIAEHFTSSLQKTNFI